MERLPMDIIFHCIVPYLIKGFKYTKNINKYSKLHAISSYIFRNYNYLYFPDFPVVNEDILNLIIAFRKNVFNGIRIYLLINSLYHYSNNVWANISQISEVIIDINLLFRLSGCTLCDIETKREINLSKSLIVYTKNDKYSYLCPKHMEYTFKKFTIIECLIKTLSVVPVRCSSVKLIYLKFNDNILTISDRNIDKLHIINTICPYNLTVYITKCNIGVLYIRNTKNVNHIIERCCIKKITIGDNYSTMNFYNSKIRNIVINSIGCNDEQILTNRRQLVLKMRQSKSISK